MAAADTHHHAATAEAPPVDPAALLADRQRTWHAFVQAATLCIGLTVVFLVLLALFVG